MTESWCAVQAGERKNPLEKRFRRAHHRHYIMNPVEADTCPASRHGAEKELQYSQGQD